MASQLTQMPRLYRPAALATAKWLTVLMLLLVGLGCQAIDFYDHTADQPLSKALEPPREMSMVSLPAYRIEPPDMLQIDVIKLVPLPPYRVDTYDVLQVTVVGTLLEQPIDGGFLVEAEGTLPIPKMTHAQLADLMKIAMKISRQSKQKPVAHMTHNLINQLLEIMPELRHVISQYGPECPRRLEEYGLEVEHSFLDDMIMDCDE